MLPACPQLVPGGGKSAPVALAAPSGSGAMLVNPSSGRLEWIQPSGASRLHCRVHQLCKTSNAYVPSSMPCSCLACLTTQLREHARNDQSTHFAEIVIYHPLSSCVSACRTCQLPFVLWQQTLREASWIFLRLISPAQGRASRVRALRRRSRASSPSRRCPRGEPFWTLKFGLTSCLGTGAAPRRRLCLCH